MIILGNYLENKQRLESVAADKKKAIFDEMLSYFNEKIDDVKKSISDMEDTLNYIAGDRRIIESLSKFATMIEGKKKVNFSFAIQTLNRIKPVLSSDGIRLFFRGFVMTKNGIIFQSDMRGLSNVSVDNKFPEAVSRYFRTSRCKELSEDIKYIIDTFNESVKDDFFEIISNCQYINEL